MELTPKQEKAVQLAETGQHVKIYGGPGTGKTETLAAVYIKMVEHIDVEHMAAVAFNVAVADKIAQRIGKETGMPFKMLRNDLYICTFHGLCNRILRRHLEIEPTIINERELASMIIKTDDSKSQEVAKSIIAASELFEERTGIFPDNDQILNILQHEVQQLASSGYINWNINDVWKALYDDNILENLTESRDKRLKDTLPNCTFFELQLIIDKTLEKIDFFDAILVDEIQDFSALQWKILNKIDAQKILIGDDDQSIYSFRGADPRKFLRHPGESVVLDISFRFNTAHAQRLENAISRFITERQKKEIEGRGADILIDIAPIHAKEYEGCILGRVNSILDTLSKELTAINVPHILERSGMIQRMSLNPLIRKVDKIITFINSDDVESFLTRLSPYIRKKGLGYKKMTTEEKLSTIKQLYPHYLSIYEALSNMNAHEKIRFLSSSKDKTLHKQAEIMIKMKIQNIESWIKNTANPKLLLSTVHRFKGRESNNIMILGFRKGLFPLQRIASITNFEEETRIAYVAMSRSRKRIQVDGTETPFHIFLR